VFEIGTPFLQDAKGAASPLKPSPPSQVTQSRFSQLKWSSRTRSLRPSASTRVLKNAAFQKVLEIIDPVEGPVWRWGAHGEKLLSASFAGHSGFRANLSQRSEFRIRSWCGNRIWRAMNANVELVGSVLLHLARPGWKSLLVDSQFFCTTD
jgi:hypothetical protein